MMKISHGEALRFELSDRLGFFFIPKLAVCAALVQEFVGGPAGHSTLCGFEYGSLLREGEKDSWGVRCAALLSVDRPNTEMLLSGWRRVVAAIDALDTIGQGVEDYPGRKRPHPFGLIEKYQHLVRPESAPPFQAWDPGAMISIGGS